MSTKQFIPAIKYGNAVTSDEVDLSGATGDVTFTAGNPTTSTQSITALNPAIGQTAVKALTSAQILALNSTPITLVTTTVGGTALVLQSLVFEMNGTSTTYTAGGALSVVYHGFATNVLAGTIPSTVVSTASSGALGNVNAYEALGTGLIVVPNCGLDITNATTNFTTGTGTAKVFVNYYIITI